MIAFLLNWTPFWIAWNAFLSGVLFQKAAEAYRGKSMKWGWWGLAGLFTLVLALTNLALGYARPWTR